MTAVELSDILLKAGGCVIGLIIFYWVRGILLGKFND